MKDKRLAINSLIGAMIGILYLPIVFLGPLVSSLVGPSFKEGLWMSAGLIIVFPAAIAANYWPYLGGSLLIVSSFVTGAPILDEYRRYNDRQSIGGLILLAIPALIIGLRALYLGSQVTVVRRPTQD